MNVFIKEFNKKKEFYTTDSNYEECRLQIDTEKS